MAGNRNAKAGQRAPRTSAQLLTLLLAAQDKIKERAKQENVEEPPFLLQHTEPILFLNTINFIQGQQGAHKSRLAALWAAVILAGPNVACETLGFTRAPGDYDVVYVDTERNLHSEFPAAIQRIKLWAGYSREQEPPHLWHTSLVPITDRTERFQALNVYLEHVRTQTKGRHLIVILDVLTDCIVDFNDSRDSLEFVDMLNEAINTYDVTFIGIIHENPGTSKARGHLGTEITNKGGTALQIGYIKAGNNAHTDVIRILYVKRRHGRNGLSSHARYDDTTKQFTPATAEQVTEARAARQKVATADAFSQALAVVLDQPLKQTELVKRLCEYLLASDRTIRDRLKEAVGTSFADKDGQLVELTTQKKGATVNYSLVPVPSTKDRV